MSTMLNSPAVQFNVKCERVKMVDMHPKEPIFIGALYTGVIHLWNYETEELVKSFDTGAGVPVRCARFIPRLQSFVCGGDDMCVGVYNYNTMERTKVFQAHNDYIRSIAVHDQLTIVLTCSDDMTIRQWDWSRGWALQMTYEGHSYYCMAVTFNPRDPSTFASASLDTTVRVWSINNPASNFTLEGHEDGVNCVEYYPRGDRPYLLSGSDDQTVRMWDYQTRACLQVFAFHTNNVTAVLFHPDQPLIFTVAEDMEMKVISSETFRLLHNLDHSVMERAWSLSAKRDTNALVVGYDNGVTVFKVGQNKPIYSMDSNGRVLVATGNEITRMDIKGVPPSTADGEVLSIPSKDMGAVETTPRAVLHGPSGQFITVIGDSDYTIISSLSLRPKSYGSCLSFIWGAENGTFAVLETSMKLKVYKNFKERATLSLPEAADKLFAGPLFAVRTSGSIVFYDWGTLSVIRQIDEYPQSVQWSTSGELVALATDTAVFLLKFNSEDVAQHLEQNGHIEGDGLDFAFELVEEVDEKVKEVTWVGDCLVFINQAHRLNYYIGGDINSIAVLTRNQYLLGYLPKENRIFCIDKDKNITSYMLEVSTIEYMAAIVREDFDTAAEILPSIKENLRDKLAHFLQARGLLELALEVTTEDAHRFDLAVQLKQPVLANEIAERAPSAPRWKQVGDVALEKGFIDIATEAFTKCGDYSGLLLIYTSVNNVAAISQLGDKCMASGKANLAFTCYHLTQRYSDCVELLCRTGKVGEAAFYARTYCPESIEEIVAKWKVTLAAIPRIREAIANPASYPNLFPTLKAVAKPEEAIPPTAAAVVAAQDAAEEDVEEEDAAAEQASPASLPPQPPAPQPQKPLSGVVSPKEASVGSPGSGVYAPAAAAAGPGSTAASGSSPSLNVGKTSAAQSPPGTGAALKTTSSIESPPSPGFAEAKPLEGSGGAPAYAAGSAAVAEDAENASSLNPPEVTAPPAVPSFPDDDEGWGN